MNGQRRQGQDPYYGIHQLAGTLGQMAQFKQKKGQMATDLAMKYIPHVTWETYDDFQDWNKQMGSILPTPDLGSKNEFNRWQTDPADYKATETWGDPELYKPTNQYMQKSSLGKRKVLYTPPGTGMPSS